MDGIETPIASNREIALKMIDGAIDDALIIENWIKEVRDKFATQLHPWAMPSLRNAVGSIQHAIDDLKSARHHIETPEPPIDAEFTVIKD